MVAGELAGTGQESPVTDPAERSSKWQVYSETFRKAYASSSTLADLGRQYALSQPLCR